MSDNMETRGQTSLVPRGQIAFAYIGCIVPDEPRFHNAAFSPSGQKYQQELLLGLNGAGIPPSLILSLVPTPTYPKAPKLFIQGGAVSLADSLQVTLVPFLNITPLKQTMVGIATVLHLLHWRWRTRAADFRVVYTYNLTVPPGLFTLLGARLIGAKAIVSLCDVNVPGETVPSGWLWKFDYWLQNRLIPRFDGHVVASDVMAREFIPGRPYLRVEGGVRDKMLERDPISFDAKRNPRKPFVITAAGTLNEANGIPVLLEAFSLLETDQYRLQIAGGGPLEQQVREAAANNSRIVYLGSISFSEVLELYRQSDVLVNMRITERLNTRYFFPGKMMEYLASGTPVITTCTGHTEEEFGDFTYLLKDETSQGLAEIIRRVASLAPEERGALGRRAQEYMALHKTWDAQAKKVVQFISAIVQAYPVHIPGSQIKPRILVLADWYLPGYKAGGALTAICNLIELMGDEFDFYVFTRDRDFTEDRPYSGVCLDRWAKIGKAQVFHTADLSFRNLRRRIREIAPQIIYLNSFFSQLTAKTLLLRRLRLLTAAAIVLAPRGEFSCRALELKSLRKLFYRKAAFAGALCRNILWQATSTREEQQIRAIRNRNGSRESVNIQLAPDVPNPNLLSAPSPALRPAKNPGSALFVFLSRVSRMKNLQFALELLGVARGEIQFDIYGPIGDLTYWQACQEQIRRLPSSIRVSYRGSVQHDKVSEIFGKHHFQVLPTLGENFGYVIAESLAAGCPILTSDQTPWGDLQKRRAGWDLPLEDRGKWRQAIQSCVEMDQETYKMYSQGARSYFEDWQSSSDHFRTARELFQRTLGATAPSAVTTALERSAGAGD